MLSGSRRRAFPRVPCARSRVAGSTAPDETTYGKHQDSSGPATLDRRPPAPQAVARAGADGPRTRDEPAQAREARQPQAGAVEAPFTAVHRGTVPPAVWQGRARGGRIHRGAGTADRKEEGEPQGRPSRAQANGPIA